MSSFGKIFHFYKYCKAVKSHPHSKKRKGLFFVTTFFLKCDLEHVNLSQAILECIHNPVPSPKKKTAVSFM
jgi:hypothetical protein